MRAGTVWRGPWDLGAETAGEGSLVLFASWARGEPERGRYDEAELASWRRAVVTAKKRGADVWVVVHAGSLPDWQIARDGWMDPDALATWGCWVDRLGRALTEAVTGWIGLWDPLGEASFYDGDARRVGRVLLDAQAVSYLQLHRGTGALAREVGAAVMVAPPAPRGMGTRFTTAAHRFTTEAWVRAAATGRVGPPFALTGELPNGTAALDRVVLVGEESTTRITTFGRSVTRVVGGRVREGG